MWSALIVPADRSQENTPHTVAPLTQAPSRFRPACCAQAHGPTGRPHACERWMLTFEHWFGNGHDRNWHEAGVFGAAARQSVYWGFKRPISTSSTMPSVTLSRTLQSRVVGLRIG